MLSTNARDADSFGISYSLDQQVHRALLLACAQKRRLLYKPRKKGTALDENNGVEIKPAVMLGTMS